MKSEKTTAFAIAGILLAVAIGVFSYFLFYRKTTKTAREIARESPVQTPASGNVIQDSAPETLDPAEEEAEEETEPKSSLPIPFIVKTNSVNRISNSVQIISKSHYLPSQPDCESYSFSWEEVKLADKKVTATVNKAIRDEVKLYEAIAESGPGIPAEFCNGEAEYEFIGKLSLFGNLLHATYFWSEFYLGSNHPNSVLDTNCFDVKTGKKVNLRQLIKPDKQAELDSMIVNDVSEIEWEGLNHAFRQQLPDLNFEFTKEGLVVIVNGINYMTTRLTLELNREKTAYFLKPEIYDMVYKKQNSFSR